MSALFGCTIMRKTPRELATKRAFIDKATGEILFDACGTGLRFEMQPAEWSDLDGLEKLLRGLALKRDRYVVRGAPAAGLDITAPQFRRLHGRPGEAATLVSTPRRWVAIDIDGVPVPPGAGRPGEFTNGARWLRDAVLPDAFVGVECIATPTSKTGFVGPDTWRGRLWFHLSSPVSDEALELYFKGFRLASGFKIDETVCRTVQPNYTARAFFDDGLVDPFTADQLVQRVPAAPRLGSEVPLDEEACRAAYADDIKASEARVSAAYSAAGGGFAGHLASIGVDGVFFENLKKTIGAAVTAGLPLDVAQARIAARLAECADLDRQRAYGARWVEQAFNSFTKRNSANAERDRASIAELAAFFSNSKR